MHGMRFCRIRGVRKALVFLPTSARVRVTLKKREAEPIMISGAGILRSVTLSDGFVIVPESWRDARQGRRWRLYLRVERRLKRTFDAPRLSLFKKRLKIRGMVHRSSPAAAGLGGRYGLECARHSSFQAPHG
jgi:hypothetical protein